MSGYLCAKFGVNRGHIHGEPPEMQNILNLLGHDSNSSALGDSDVGFKLRLNVCNLFLLVEAHNNNMCEATTRSITMCSVP